MTFKQQKKDFGFDKIKASFAAFDGRSVEVGIIEDHNPKNKNSDATVAEYGAYNEYGTKHIPARPFISTAFDENLNDLNGKIDGLISAVTEGKTNADYALDVLGLHHGRQITEKILSITSPPNTKGTIAGKKGGDKPLEDTGLLKQSIRHKVR